MELIASYAIVNKHLFAFLTIAGTFLVESPDIFSNAQFPVRSKHNFDIGRACTLSKYGLAVLKYDKTNNANDGQWSRLRQSPE